ncbi:MAG: 16S rRNA (guanine(966)-N(2))-methyltransferase RsmD [Oscillospiraceae bacterium]
MRVISGSARGTKLETLEGDDTRPTIDRVKEGICSAVQFILPQASILDLFAGSGQMGIEALSRGAKNAVFVDDNRAAVDIIIENLKKVKLFPQSKVLNMSAEQYLTASSDKFDIVFMDPPYNNNTVNKILPNLFTRLNENAVVFCETELTAELPQSLGNLEKQKTYKYGKVLVTKYIFKS